MKEFFRRISPKRAVLDFFEVWTLPQRHRWPVLGLAMAITFSMFMLFAPESQRAPPAKPDIIYVTTFDETRTQQQIIASNCRNQALKDQLQDLLDQRAELRREMYMAMGRATFIDVDQMAADADAEKAREEAAAAARGDNQPPPNDPTLNMSVEEYCASALGEG